MNLRPAWLLRLFLLAGVILSAAACGQVLTDGYGHGTALGVYSKLATQVLAVVAASGIGYLGLLGLSFTPYLARMLHSLERFLRRLGGLNWVLFLTLSAGMPLLAFSARFAEAFTTLLPRLWLMYGLALAMGLLLRAALPKTSALTAALAGALLQGVVILIFAQAPNLSDSAFSLSWSETSRFYNASLYFAPQLYGQSLPLPTLHPTRYLLQSLAFLVPGGSLAFHRAWQAFLWLACNGLVAWALARRLKLPDRLQVFLAAAWALLFFFLAPIYYHLVLCAVPVLLFYDRRKPRQTALALAVASIWAGLSRLNWYPVPGALAAVLYLLEEPQAGRQLWRYLLPAAVWGLAGSALAFVSNETYIRLSGNPPEVFGSALSSPLLWERLWPSPVYGTGPVLLGLAAFGPALLAGFLSLLPGRRIAPRHWKFIRPLGLVGILGVFLAGGLVVSAKIGGGGSLHNLDNFVLFAAVIGLYLVHGRFVPDRIEVPEPRPRPAWLALLVLAVALQPLVIAAGDMHLPEPRRAEPEREAEVLAELQGYLDKYGGNGPVLFISDRHLVTLGLVRVKSFEAEYEKVFLMEMAMANNRSYLGRFAREVSEQKFSLIISEALNAEIQKPDEVFAEENNAWVERVEWPVLMYYRQLQDFADVRLYVYAPR